MLSASQSMLETVRRIPRRADELQIIHLSVSQSTDAETETSKYKRSILRLRSWVCINPINALTEVRKAQRGDLSKHAKRP